MTTDEVIRYVLSFLGGGVVSGGMAWAREALSRDDGKKSSISSANSNRSTDLSTSFTTQDVELFDLAKRFHAAYRAEDALHRRQMRDTLLLANQYVERVDRNNEKIMGILESNWHLIDPDDTEVFAGFQVKYTRLRTERNGQRWYPVDGVAPGFRALGDVAICDLFHLKVLARTLRSMPPGLPVARGW